MQTSRKWMSRVDKNCSEARAVIERNTRAMMQLINHKRLNGRGNCFQQGLPQNSCFSVITALFSVSSWVLENVLPSIDKLRISWIVWRLSAIRMTQIAQSFNVAVYCFRTWFSEPYSARYEYRFWRTGKHCGIERMVRCYLARPPVHSGCDY